ncbi:MAG: peptidoglycan-binding protein [Oscillospiraceae bacterium]|nr:peptidoglycan-binding protein [Oscillospiraceae bacterium]
MRPPESFIGQPIRSLQTMLRVIAEADPSHIPVIPDGIYGPETMQAVSVFQRKHGLPVSGVTDQATWEAVVAVYEPALIDQDEAEMLHIVLNPGQIIRKGERHPHLYLVQGMLLALSEVYGSIGKPTSSGILDDATEDAIASFQFLSGLPATGQLDKHTWKQLALQYPLAANLQSLTPNYSEKQQ